MNPNEPWNSVGAQVVVDALKQIDGLKGILCFGSYYMGCFDANSDVDLYALWHPQVPSSNTRRSVLHQIKGIEDLDIEHIEPRWPPEEWFPHCDRFRFNGVLFDLGYNTLDWMTAAVREAREFPQELSGRKSLNMLALLDNSAILDDQDECLSGLVSQLHPFPSDLKTALISEHMTSLKGSLEEILEYTRRGIGNTAFQFHLMRIASAIGGILFAVNERYNPLAKRAEEAFKKLHLTPPSFLERYGEMMSTALDQEGRKKTTRNVALLVEDLEQLIEGEAEPAHAADRGR